MEAFKSSLKKIRQNLENPFSTNENYDQFTQLCENISSSKDYFNQVLYPDENVAKDFVGLAVSIFLEVESTFSGSIEKFNREKSRTFIIMIRSVTANRSDAFLRFAMIKIREFLALASGVPKKLMFDRLTPETYANLFHGFMKWAETYLTLQIVLRVFIQVLQEIGEDSAEVALNAIEFNSKDAQKNSRLKLLFSKIGLDNFEDTSRDFLNYFNSYGDAKCKIFPIKGTVSSSEIKTKEIWMDFNIFCLSLSFDASFNHLVFDQEEYSMEIERCEINQVSGGLVLIIQPTEYKILKNFEDTGFKWDASEITFMIEDTRIKMDTFEQKVFPIFKQKCGVERNPKEPEPSFDLIPTQQILKRSPIWLNESQVVDLTQTSRSSQPYFEVLKIEPPFNFNEIHQEPSPTPLQAAPTRKSSRLSLKPTKQMEPLQKSLRTPPKSSRFEIKCPQSNTRLLRPRKSKADRDYDFLSHTQRQPEPESCADLLGNAGARITRTRSASVVASMATSTEIDIQFKEPEPTPGKRQRLMMNSGSSGDASIKEATVVLARLHDSGYGRESSSFQEISQIVATESQSTIQRTTLTVSGQVNLNDEKSEIQMQLEAQMNLAFQKIQEENAEKLATTLLNNHDLNAGLIDEKVNKLMDFQTTMKQDVLNHLDLMKKLRESEEKIKKGREEITQSLGEICDLNLANVENCQAAVLKRREILGNVESSGQQQVEEAKVSVWKGFVDQIKGQMNQHIDRVTSSWYEI